MDADQRPSAVALDALALEVDPDRVDVADEDAFNRVLWALLKGQRPYARTKRMSALEMVRAC
jgi:hypothetical protein